MNTSHSVVPEAEPPPARGWLYYSWRTKSGIRLNLVMNEEDARRWAELKGLEVERIEGAGMTRQEISSL